MTPNSNWEGNEIDTIYVEGILPQAFEIEKFKIIQTALSRKISLRNSWGSECIKSCAGVDVAYFEKEGMEWGVCSIVVIHYDTMEVVEETSSVREITVPYVPGYLSFRELPLIIEAAKKLTKTPDLFMFDGNGYLHPRHMGIAAHASFILNKPTIGVAKSYYKIDNVELPMPKNIAGSYENIIVKGEIYGRVLRSHKNVQPIFISCGNYIDLQTTTEITLHFISDESRIPIPVRLADLESRRKRNRIRS